MSFTLFTERILPIKDRLFRLALRLLGDREEAEDAVQDVMVRVWSKRAEWGEWDSVEAYCMTATRNGCLDRLRKKKWRVVGEDGAHELGSQEKDPHEKMAGKETYNRIRKCMEELPQNQQLVIQLREIEGFSYQEIAGVLDMTMDQVKINLFRARSSIRKVITKEEGTWRTN